MSISIERDESFLTILKAQLVVEMKKAAEPVLQQALKEAESAMRERLAACLISHIESTVSMQRYGHELRIVIDRGNGL